MLVRLVGVMDEKQGGGRIARNSMVLYVRLLISMAVSIYTSRIVLRALGIDDFGIFTAVGSIVLMMSILTGALSSAVGRFITFELGKGNAVRLRKIFVASQVVQLGMAVVVVLLVETVGMWYVRHEMDLPPERLEAAVMLLHFLIPSFAFSLLIVPYQAAVIAHERMGAYAILSLVENFGKLGVAFILLQTQSDRLTLYAALLSAVTLLVLLLYWGFCHRTFAEVRGRYTLDRALIKEMTKFSSWNLISHGAVTLRDHGTTLLITQFFSPAVIAARGLSLQISQALNQFSASIVTAVNPQVTKSFAQGDRSYMMSLLLRGCRFAYYTVWIVSLPVLVQTHTVLDIWQDVVPEYTVVFVRLVVVFTLLESLSGPLINAMLATGRIRNYQLIVGGLLLLNLPVSYFLLRQGFPVTAPLWVILFFSVASLCTRLIMLRRMIQFPVRKFLRGVLLNVLLVSLLSALPVVLFSWYCMDSLWTLLGVCVLSVISSGVCIWTGCSKDDKQLLRQLYQRFVKRNSLKHS